MKGQPLPITGDGKMTRDFTYVDDIVDGMIRLLPMPPEKDVAWSPIAPRASSSGVAPYRILNIGRGRSEPLTRFVEVLEKTLGRKATIEKLPMQSGDVEATHADTSSLRALTGFSPKVDIEDGINAFVREERVVAFDPTHRSVQLQLVTESLRFMQLARCDGDERAAL